MPAVRQFRSRSARLAGVGVLASLSLLAGGCGSNAHAPKGATLVGINERDYHIGAQRQDLRAGLVDFAVDNHGPDAHELIVVRAQGAQLPLRTDGLTVNEEALQHDEAGSLEPGQPGGVRHLLLRLAPGRYVLFCNMSGHFMGGMHTELVVR